MFLESLIIVIQFPISLTDFMEPIQRTKGDFLLSVVAQLTLHGR